MTSHTFNQVWIEKQFQNKNKKSTTLIYTLKLFLYFCTLILNFTSVKRIVYLFIYLFIYSQQWNIDLTSSQKVETNETKINHS